ncbi:FkbM family methyltransferase [Micromonospora craniellae]|uniref:FkbM family methyltransferase n=1 Tax=Micromonospora craniellae TaxID=2294034 RepID=A0A372FS79_9ACTN|nr:FkbM family methyltransferase [Micromonospora craniellae]QOC93483.1 FkbM family methyltransferase [Micromonospora craniellae]RFS43474.1 FkbM family methyltransferase [Micromonospora craniellae]
MPVSRFVLTSGLHLYAQSRSEAQFQYDEIFGHDCYKVAGLRPNAVVVDVGANIGLYTLFVKQHNPDAHIYAFEPIPESAEAFEKNILLHGLRDVRLTRCGIGAQPEPRAPFTYYPNTPGNSTRYPEQKQLQIDLLTHRHPRLDYRSEYRAEIVSAPIEPLSAVLPSSPVIDLLKVDAEGAELDILIGVKDRDWQRIKRVVLEVQDVDGHLAKIASLLTDRGYVAEVRPSPMIEPELRTFLVTASR